MSAALLHYRPWRGHFRPSWCSIWPIARVALGLIFRQWLFWGLYLLGLMVFLLYFFGQYILIWAASQGGEERLPVLAFRVPIRQVVHILGDILQLNGGGETYRNFIAYQGYVVMVVLAFAGSLLVGNDVHHGSLPFYLSKPVSPWHYLLGKALAVAVFINLMTTLPALGLFAEHVVFRFQSWEWLAGELILAAGILGYGLVITVPLSLLLVATASGLRRTVPMVMAWTTLFLFTKVLASALVDQMNASVRWRLLDLWHDAYLIGNALLGLDPASLRPLPQPPWYEGALVLGGVSVLCLTYLTLRIRAVEIVA